MGQSTTLADRSSESHATGKSENKSCYLRNYCVMCYRLAGLTEKISLRQEIRNKTKTTQQTLEEKLVDRQMAVNSRQMGRKSSVVNKNDHLEFHMAYLSLVQFSAQ